MKKGEQKRWSSACLEVEVQQDDHFAFTGLEKGVFDVVIEHVHLFSTESRVPKSVDVGLEGAGNALLGERRPNEEILEPRLT